MFGSVCVCVNSAPQAWLQQKLVVSDLYITALLSEADSTVAFKQTPCLKTVYQAGIYLYHPCLLISNQYTNVNYLNTFEEG